MNKLLISIYLSVFIVLNLENIAVAQEVSLNNIEEIENSMRGFEAIINYQLYDKKSEYFLVFPGRSMTVLRAMIEDIDPSWGVGIPATDTGNYIIDENIYSHFDYYMSDALKNRGSRNKILVIDYINEGYGVKQWYDVFKKYALARGFETKFLGVRSGYRICHLVLDFDFLTSAFPELEWALGAEKFDYLSSYGSYRYGLDDPLSLITNSRLKRYNELKSYVSRYISKNQLKERVFCSHNYSENLSIGSDYWF